VQVIHLQFMDDVHFSVEALFKFAWLNKGNGRYKWIWAWPVCYLHLSTMTLYGTTSINLGLDFFRIITYHLLGHSLRIAPHVYRCKYWPCLQFQWWWTLYSCSKLQYYTTKVLPY
jgi:hypothetical protein